MSRSGGPISRPKVDRKRSWRGWGRQSVSAFPCATSSLCLFLVVRASAPLVRPLARPPLAGNHQKMFTVCVCAPANLKISRRLAWGPSFFLDGVYTLSQHPLWLVAVLWRTSLVFPSDTGSLGGTGCGREPDIARQLPQRCCSAHPQPRRRRSRRDPELPQRCLAQMSQT